jgi:hypothetical protein
MLWFQGDGLQDEEVERALWKFQSVGGHAYPLRFDRKQDSAASIETQAECRADAHPL